MSVADSLIGTPEIVHSGHVCVNLYLSHPCCDFGLYFSASLCALIIVSRVEIVVTGIQ